MNLLKWTWRSLLLMAISFLVLLAIGQVQLYFRTSVDSYEDIKVGFPLHYYSFSRDGNNFHGGNGKHLIIDYFVTLTAVTIIYLIGKVIIHYFARKMSVNQKEHEIID